MTSEEPCAISHHLTDQAHKLKLLLELDDKRRRQNFIRNITERPNSSSNIEQPPHESVTASIEQRLQEQVDFYESSLLKLKERSEEITKENKKLYETMNKSIFQESEDEDENTHSSIPKERLLRRKDEFKSSQRLVSLNDSDYSLDEPGQINIARNRASFRERYGSDNIDFDASLASEPGQVPGYPQQSNSKDEREEKAIKPPVLEVEANTNNHRISLNLGNNNDLDFKSYKPSNTSDRESFDCEIKKMQEVYESKNKHLESILKNSRNQVKQHLVEIDNLKGELKMYQTPVKDGTMDLNFVKQGFVKHSERNLVQELLSERDELFKAIKKQQSIVAEGNRHETEAYYHVKTSCEMVEQVRLEKQEAIVRCKQLEYSLNEYKEKYKKLRKEHQDELSQLTRNIKKENEQTIEELNKKIDEQNVNLTVLQSHLEKSVREKLDLKNELDKFERHSVSQNSNTTALIEDAQKEVMDALKKQTLAEHETGQIRLEAKMNERRRHQEVEKLVYEVNELKRRLHVTEGNLNTCQKYQLDTTHQFNSCKQQLQQEIAKRKMLVTSFDEEKKRLQTEAVQREQELSQVIVETDKCYQLKKDELSKILESQTHIVNKYQNECKELSEKIAAEKKVHQLNVAQMREKCHQLEKYLKEVLNKEERKDKVLENYKQQFESTYHELKQKKELVMLLMKKQSAILRERYLLSKEVELLKSQTPPVLTE